MKKSIRCLVLLAPLVLAAHLSLAAEYHVASVGSDTNDGSAARPLRTISAAARLAQPGDVITVHQGDRKSVV
jgi:alpha-N-arabinofuranosidase